jgi:hypothetical protein
LTFASSAFIASQDVRRAAYDGTGRQAITRNQGSEPITIDAEQLSRLRRYEAPESEIYEEFLERRVGRGGAFALLAGPLGAPRDEGWIVCPSIGPEHGNLRRLEAIVARTLAKAGYPVLRLRPDVDPVDGLRVEIDLAARLHEVEDAVRTMTDDVGARSVGVLGSFFGATAAALACEQLALREMVLIEPVARGKAYLKEIMRRHAVAELVGTVDEHGPDGAAAQQRETAAPRERLAAEGHAALQGMGLSRAEAERIAAVDLVGDLRSFDGRSLLVGISPSGALSPSLARLRDHLASLGGQVATTAVEDPLFAPFGEYYFRNAGPVRVDTRLGLDERVASTIAAWAIGRTADAPVAAT